MKTAPIAPAALSRTAHGVAYSALYGDVYHPRAGALEQARHVFLGGNRLPERWAGRERFVVLEVGFGLGNNFLATWHAWRDDARRATRLHYIAIEKHPLARDELMREHASSPLADRARELFGAWPPATHNLHRLAFDAGRVQLLLAFGDASVWLPEIVASIDAIYLDGFAPDRNPALWEPRLLKALARLCVPGTTAATWCAAREVREALRDAGFEVEKRGGFGGKREMTLARYAPRFAARRPAARAVPYVRARHAVIVGAGLAGCATALALAELGWTSTLIDRAARPASEASGNPAGLFHGSVHAADGLHARFNRAAALEIERWLRCAGAMRAAGLLRIETRRDLVAMRAIEGALGLPESFVRAVDRAEASELSGLPLRAPAWWFAGGGVADPRRLAESWLAAAGDAVELRCDVDVQALRRAGDVWRLLDACDRVVGEAEVVVLANAAGALPLIGSRGWPLARVRGQLSSVAAAMLGTLVPRCAVAGAGYVLPPVDGRVWFGATSRPHDDDATLRESDQRANLDALSTLTGWQRTLDGSPLGGRVAWRLVAADRLPLIGALPIAATAHQQVRFVPREPGLFVFVALASRGIAWSLLGARVLASLVAGTPCPVEASLLDAVDPARFAVRQARRA